MGRVPHPCSSLFVASTKSKHVESRETMAGLMDRLPSFLRVLNGNQQPAARNDPKFEKLPPHNCLLVASNAAVNGVQQMFPKLERSFSYWFA